MPILIAAVLIAAAALFVWQDARAGTADDNGGSTGGVSGNGFTVNNPGNLRYIAGSNAFNGQTGQTASGIAIYDTLQNGCRAMYLQLQEYAEAGHDTLTSMITTYAPPSENDTATYIANVSAATGIDPATELVWTSDGLPVCYAMIVQENGQATVNTNQFTQETLQTLLQNAGVI